MGRRKAQSARGSTAGGKGASGRCGDAPGTDRVFLQGPDRYQTARQSWLMSPVNGSQKRWIEMEAGSSDHSLEKDMTLQGQEALLVGSNLKASGGQGFLAVGMVK